MTQLPETELAGIARGREAFARFGWKPYMHNPHLKRWLHRIDIPTLLLWGEQDGIVRTILWRGLARGDSRRAHGCHLRTPATSRTGNSREASPTGSRVSPKPTEERAMRCWYFSEMAYHPAWEAGLARGTLRVVLPSSNFDPPTAHGLLNRYLDEFALCDEVGLDIMVNEHHSTATCMTVSVPMALAIIARETKRARLLSLGNPIANRPDPVRVAEEMAWLDVLSGGRLEMGLVKGAPYEIQPANSNPATLMRRYWEAHDLILKAMSTHDGPFNWEGEFFHYRSVNIWPKPVQKPTPPVWMTGMSVGYRHAGGGTRPRGGHAAVGRHGEADVRRVSPTRARTGLGGRAGPDGLCRGGRRRRHARGRAAAGRSDRRLCAHRAGGGGAVHQSARLQLDRRQRRDHAGRAARASHREGPAGQHDRSPHAPRCSSSWTPTPCSPARRTTCSARSGISPPAWAASAICCSSARADS